MKPTIALDFDGVLNNYKGYDGDNLGTPRQGAKEFLQTLSKNHKVIILTARNFAKVLNWLQEYDLSKYVYDVTNIKQPATEYIDDRAIPFNGDYEDTLAKLEYFEPYWK